MHLLKVQDSVGKRLKYISIQGKANIKRGCHDVAYSLIVFFFIMCQSEYVNIIICEQYYTECSSLVGCLIELAHKILFF